MALGSPGELKGMVGGDVVTLRTRDDRGAAEEIGRRFGLEPLLDSGGLRLEVEDGASFVPRLLRELSVSVDTVTLSRPSLDDVFLKLTGHAIRDEEVGARDRMRAMAGRWRGARGRG